MKFRLKFSVEIIVIGFALFSMFFGSGNLIYPLFVGVNSQSAFSGALGFNITGAILPILGVFVMILYQGHSEKFFSIIGKRCGTLLAVVLLTVWIPLGSGPRCITLAHAAFDNLLGGNTHVSLLIFATIYSLIVYAIVAKEKFVINILGRILTPILLFCLLSIIYMGYNGSFDFSINPENIKLGLIEGYNTMDFIAAIFFTIALFSRVSAKDKTQTLVSSSFIGISLLIFVYVGLLTVAMQHSGDLAQINKEKLFVVLASLVLPSKLSIITTITMILSCITTSVALNLVLIDGLSKQKKYKFSHKQLTLFSICINYLMSLFGFAIISELSGILLKVSYPILLMVAGIGIYSKISCYIREPNTFSDVNKLAV